MILEERVDVASWKQVGTNRDLVGLVLKHLPIPERKTASQTNKQWRCVYLSQVHRVKFLPPRGGRDILPWLKFLEGTPGVNLYSECVQWLQGIPTWSSIAHPIKLWIKELPDEYRGTVNTAWLDTRAPRKDGPVGLPG